MNPEKAVVLAVREMIDATEEYGAFNSAHEGWAVILEEVEELWDEIKKHKKDRSTERMKHEAKQVAAMGLRFLIDVC